MIGHAADERVHDLVDIIGPSQVFNLAIVRQLRLALDIVVVHGQSVAHRRRICERLGAFFMLLLRVCCERGGGVWNRKIVAQGRLAGHDEVGGSLSRWSRVWYTRCSGQVRYDMIWYGKIRYLVGMVWYYFNWKEHVCYSLLSGRDCPLRSSLLCQFVV